MTTRSPSLDAYAPPRRTRVIPWLLRIVLAAVFLAAGLAKLSGDPAMVQMFDTIGAGQWLRYAVGACEVAGAIGVLTPRLSVLAASGLALLMIGATVTNLTILDASPAMPLGILVIAAITVWLGRSLGRATTGQEGPPVSARYGFAARRPGRPRQR